MTVSELKKLTEPSKNLSPLLLALWHDHQGNWVASHNLAQEVHTKDGSWVHAYLHRKEGDLSNANYWYYQAGRKMPSVTLDEEWEHIVKVLLERMVD